MNQRPSEEEYASNLGEYIRLVPEAQHHRHSARSGKANDRAAGIVDRKRWHVSVCRRKMDVERSRGPHCRRRTRHGLPPAPVRKRDQTPLSGFDQELFMPPFGNWTTAQLAEDYRAVRQSTITLLRGLPAEAWSRKGTANKASITPRALAYGIAGHEIHHMGVIRNRYLS